MVDSGSSQSVSRPMKIKTWLNQKNYYTKMMIDKTPTYFTFLVMHEESCLRITTKLSLSKRRRIFEMCVCVFELFKFCVWRKSEYDRTIIARKVKMS